MLWRRHCTKLNLHVWFVGIKISNLNCRDFLGLFIGPQIKFGFGPKFSARLQLCGRTPPPALHYLPADTDVLSCITSELVVLAVSLALLLVTCWSVLLAIGWLVLLEIGCSVVAFVCASTSRTGIKQTETEYQNESSKFFKKIK